MKYFILTIFFLFLFSCSDFDVKKINCKDDGDCPNTYTCNTQTHICVECNECGDGDKCFYSNDFKTSGCCDGEYEGNFDVSQGCYIPCDFGKVFSKVELKCVGSCSGNEAKDLNNLRVCKCKEAYTGDKCLDCNTEAGYIAEGEECVPDCNLIKGGDGAILQDGECVCESEGYTLYTDEEDVKRCVPSCSENSCTDNNRSCVNGLCLCNSDFEYNQNGECVLSCNLGECEPNGVCMFDGNVKYCECYEGYFTTINNLLSCIECDEFHLCETDKICVDFVCKDIGDCGLNAYEGNNGCVCIQGYTNVNGVCVEQKYKELSIGSNHMCE